MINKKIKKIIVVLLLFISTIAMSGSFARIISINHNVDGKSGTSTDNVRKEKTDWGYSFELYEQDGRWAGPLKINNAMYTRYGRLVSSLNKIKEGEKITYWTRAKRREECHLTMHREFPWDWGTRIKGRFSPDKF